MPWLRRWVLVGFLVTAFGAPLARGQPAQAPSVDKGKARAAKQYVEAGLAAQSTGDYDTAITFYQKAYELLPHPVLWFNIAQAHRLAGRAEQALEFYAKYLAADPNGTQTKTARALVAELKARQVEDAREAEAARQVEAARQAEAARQVEAARKANELRQAEDSRRATARQAQARQVDRTADPKRVAAPALAGRVAPAETPGRALRLYGVGLSAVGVVSLAVGIGFGLSASSLSDDLSRRGAVYDPAKVDSGQTANGVAIVGLVAGTVALAVGVTLYWRGRARSRDADAVTLAPMVSNQLAGLVVTGVLP